MIEQYIVKHWKGEFPLWKSWWINSFLLQNILAFTCMFLVGVVIGLSNPNRQFSVSAYELMGLIVGLPFYIWALVGTWRSARVNKTEGKGWGSLAQFGLCLGLLITVGKSIDVLVNVFA
jgi:hypothetical protein